MKDEDIIHSLENEERKRVEADHALRKELDELWNIIKLLRNDVVDLQSRKCHKK